MTGSNHTCIFWFLSVSCGFGWDELPGKALQHGVQRGADKVHHRHEGAHVPIASRPRPRCLKQAVQAFQPRGAAR